MGMELTDAIRIAVIRAFDPKHLNPLNQVFILELDEVLLLDGWDDDLKSWKVRRVATEENGLSVDLEMHVSEIGDPYMALRISSLYAQKHRVFTWETAPMDLKILLQIKEEADRLMMGDSLHEH